MDDTQTRLKEILRAQSGRSAACTLAEANYFVVLGLYLTQEELDDVWPHLVDDPDRPRLGVGLRYCGTPVYDASEQPPLRPSSAEHPGCAAYQGIRFEYSPMLYVFGGAAEYGRDDNAHRMIASPDRKSSSQEST